MSPPTRTRPLELARTRRKPMPGWRAAAVGLLAAGLVAVAPATGLGDYYLGSRLDAPATASQMFPTDTTFWQTAVAGPTGPALDFRVPANGQVIQVDLRGHVGGGFGPQPIHFQDLRPQADGQLKVVASSQQFELPATGGVWTYDPQDLCVQTGDYVGLSTEGGFNAQSAPMGVPFEVFAPTAGSSTAYFTKNAGVGNGSILTPTVTANTQLLMSAYEGTGGHASPLCGGIRGIELVAPAQTDKVKSSGATKVKVECSGPLGCVGKLSLGVQSGALAGAPLKLGSHQTAEVPVRLGSQGLALLHAGGGHLSVTASLSAGDGSPDDTTTATIKLTG